MQRHALQGECFLSGAEVAMICGPGTMGSRGRSEACSGFTRSPGVRPTKAVGYGGLEQTQDLATEAGHSKTTRVTIRTASGNSISAHEPEGREPCNVTQSNS